MKVSKILVIVLALIGIFTLVGCDETTTTPTNTNPYKPSSVVKKEEPINYVGELRVYNAAEYMDMSTVKDFEKEYKIKVIYDEFESNESLYDDVTRNASNYDVLVPSDYMIDRLIKEGRLEKLDKTKITNISNVAEEYLNPSYDVGNEYSVPYMVGTVGILYNKKQVKEPVTSWNALWDAKYSGQIWMWDSMRDVIGVALKRLGYSMNTTNEQELEEAKKSLTTQYRLLRGYAEEECRDAMIADEGILALVYAGEAKAAIDQNPNLAFVIPEEGSNKFVDGFVIVKDAKNKEAAENFINFMCRSNIAVRNMTDTGYTSPIKGAWAEFGNNQIMFPTQDELNRCEAFLYDASATAKYNRIWSEVK